MQTGTLVFVFGVVLIDIVGFLGIMAACGGLLFLASRIEPHWVAKDGRRFMTVGQDLDQFGLPAGRRRDVRVEVDPDEDALLVRGRSMLRPSTGIWTVRAKSPKPPRGRVVYILKKVSGDSATDTMTLRLPANSKMIPRMEALLEAGERD